MTWKTHLVLGAMAGYYAYPSWKGVAMGAGMGLLPDIDQTRSKLGSMVRPLSYAMQKGIGHRTLTHSWVILLLPALFFGDTFLAKAALFGLLSHLISDAMVGRIQFLWPIRQGWVGIKLTKRLYRQMDRLVFYMAVAYLLYWGYNGGAERLVQSL
ncbi:metal-dependent hydrolase [Brevibacillus nitrificans]|uniref:metal-dependent hydrolase n=1 Tax=Brevibacillus nitrificans TaxID=651560 RepID=UPI00285E8A6E|nr:metal-dependent hydrolase [Brevibacillus nitrificans]MDR7318253.1 inner membrane protein [Brevibacillus nitrificans]